MGQVWELVALIKDLNYVTSRIQLAKDRAHPVFEFAGDIDMTWEVSDRRVRRTSTVSWKNSLPVVQG